NAITDSVRHTGSSPRIPPSTARIRSRLVPRHVATGYPKTGRRITAPRCCSPRGNGSLLWSTPLLGALANGSIASPSEYTARCGPETQVMAALPSTKTSTPQLSVSKPLVHGKGAKDPEPCGLNRMFRLGCSCRRAFIVFQQAAQPLSTSYFVLFTVDCWSR